MEAAKQNVVTSFQRLQNKHVVSPETVTLFHGFVAWLDHPFNTQTCYWPAKKDYREWGVKLFAAVEHDEQVAKWYKLLCHFSKRYCW